MLLTDVLYAPIPTFEAAAQNEFELVVGQPTLDQGLHDDPLGRLTAAGLDAKAEDIQALERIGAAKGKRGAWPEVLDSDGDPTEGRIRSPKAPKKSVFAPLPEVAFSRVVGGFTRTSRKPQSVR